MSLTDYLYSLCGLFVAFGDIHVALWITLWGKFAPAKTNSFISNFTQLFTISVPVSCTVLSQYLSFFWCSLPLILLFYAHSVHEVVCGFENRGYGHAFDGFVNHTPLMSRAHAECHRSISVNEEWNSPLSQKRCLFLCLQSSSKVCNLQPRLNFQHTVFTSTCSNKNWIKIRYQYLLM